MTHPKESLRVMHENTALKLNLKPGQKLCSNCMKKERESQEHILDEEYVPFETSMHSLGEAAISLGCSPMKTVSETDQYVRKTLAKYNVEKIPEYVDEVNSGKSIYSALCEVGSGGSTILKPEEEILIVSALQFLGKCGYSQDVNDVQDMVQSYLMCIGRDNPFQDSRPGNDWMILFGKRESHLEISKSVLLMKATGEGLSQSVLDMFFDMYTEVLNTNNLTNTPHRIFNLEEIGLNTDPRSKKVFVEKSSRNDHMPSSRCGQSCYTVLFCASALGIYLPPLTIYKGKYCYESWKTGGPKRASYDSTDSGWMTGEAFEDWFCSIFIAETKDLDKPVLLIYDGHNSHITYNTVKLAMDNEVILLCLPPTNSNALQPFDVGVFKPLKVSWSHILKKWPRESRCRNPDTAVFPSLLRSLWQTLDPRHIIAGFSGAGLFPINKNAVLAYYRR